MKEITVQELKQLIDDKKDFQLIDVRELFEYEEANLNGEHIPMGDILDNLDKVSKEKTVIVHCKSGKRSASVVQALESQFGYTNLHNLKGGIIAYIEEIGL